MTTQASGERRHLNMAEYIAQANAMQIQQSGRMLRIDEALFQGMLWAAHCAQVAPEFLIAFQREAAAHTPITRLPGTPAERTVADKVRQDIATADYFLSGAGSPEERLDRWHAQWHDEASSSG